MADVAKIPAGLDLLARPEGFEPPTLRSEVGLQSGPGCNQTELGAENRWILGLGVQIPPGAPTNQVQPVFWLRRP